MAEHHTIFETIKKTTPCIFVVFGATGDLTHRKILPAIYRLKKKNHLPSNFALVAVARREKTDDEFRNDVLSSLQKYQSNFDLKVWKELLPSVYYFKKNFDDKSNYSDMEEFFENIDLKHKTMGNRVFYLSTAPDYFENIVENLKKSTIIDRRHQSAYRIIVEKPFGTDLESAKKLNKVLTSLFKEKEIYRIDHYLGKEAVQNIVVLRFANRIFESVWNSEHIENVQITAAESLGVETRGGYYEKTGAFKDMVQNHLLQLLSLVAMESPKSFETNEIKDAKTNVLKLIETMTAEEVHKNSVFGQYIKSDNGIDYRKEIGVNPSSRVETYAAIKFHINNSRWKGTPFYLRTGKSLMRKETEIVIYFREVHKKIFSAVNLKPDVLVIRLQPNEGVFLQFNAKKPGNEFALQRVSMDFCHDCLFDMNTPEAYEKLLYDVFLGESTLFTDWNGVEQAWRIMDPICKYWENSKEEPIFYKFGSWGPQEANKLMENSMHSWREPM